MTSARALKFSEALFRDLCRGRNRHFWEVVASDAKANDVRIVDAIAAALDRYEAEAWTAITDDPGSWPQTTDDVLAECAVNDVTRVRACWLAEGRWWTMTNRGVTQIATPTRYRLMPEVPR